MANEERCEPTPFEKLVSWLGTGVAVVIWALLVHSLIQWGRTGALRIVVVPGGVIEHSFREDGFVFVLHFGIQVLTILLIPCAIFFRGRVLRSIQANDS